MRFGARRAPRPPAAPPGGDYLDRRRDAPGGDYLDGLVLASTALTPSRPVNQTGYDVVKELAVQATCSAGGGAQAGGAAASPVYAQGFVEAAGTGARKLLVVNKTPLPQIIEIVGATGGSWRYVDESTAFGPPVKVAVASDTWTLAPYAMGVVRMPAA